MNGSHDEAVGSAAIAELVALTRARRRPVGPGEGSTGPDQVLEVPGRHSADVAVAPSPAQSPGWDREATATAGVPGIGQNATGRIPALAGQGATDAAAPLVAVVTGASRGIGRALVESLVHSGWRVGALARSAPRLAELASSLPSGSVLPLVADVTDRVAMAEAFAAVGALWRIPDLVVANAGVLRAVGSTWELDPQDWWDDLQVNLFGVVTTLHVALPGMLARGSGRFIAVSSGMGANPSPWSSAYGASKAAVTHLVGSVGRELAGTGVAAFAISPGMVRTQMTDWPDELLAHRPELAKLPESAFLPVERVCELVADLASGRYDVMSGRFIHARDDRAALLAAAQAKAAPSGA